MRENDKCTATENNEKEEEYKK